MQQPDTTRSDDRQVRALIDKGVVIPSPSTVYIGEDVDPARVAPGVVIHPGCRVRGSQTSIGPGSVLGEEAPATVEDCQLGSNVRLKGGFFSGSTFLNGSSVGSCAHVRAGTLLEEGASAAHSVGLKQTVLLPFVTIGSLVNFCDCLMAGGTGPKDHGEVGSSYIHFNYTPYQDKATASLLGDVPRGVMLDRPPIFLGGQGGIVGTVIAAGVVCRDDVLEEGMLHTGRTPTAGRTTRIRGGARGGLTRLFRNNFCYIGNIRALHAWYQVARSHLMAHDPYQEACFVGALNRLDDTLEERMRRLGEVAASLGGALAYTRLCEAWPALRQDLQAWPQSLAGAQDREVFLAAWKDLPVSTPYPEAVASLDSAAKAAGTKWLQVLVDDVMSLIPHRDGSGREEI
jgi:hypothetical protein